ncbi:unnamed protein product [Lactuca virosa]|uniref:Uncharacterized protein n=1 Tax=Lactuca virosa TaxID=75947 RepID=A0AAU9M2Q8_9ASTR|nr:unnamed protein product [Lactuca virosa]
MLKTLKLNQGTCKFWHGGTDEKSLIIRNRTAVAIGENLHELRRLELIGNNMTNIGLQAILDGCPHLQSLDLRECLCIDLKGGVGKKCSEKIRCLKLPEDSIGLSMIAEIIDLPSCRCLFPPTTFFFDQRQGNDIKAISTRCTSK